MGFSPERITFMTMGRLHRANSRTKLGVVSERTVGRETSILRTRLVPFKIIRRQESTETAEENWVEQDNCPFELLELLESFELFELFELFKRSGTRLKPL